MVEVAVAVAVVIASVESLQNAGQHLDLDFAVPDRFEFGNSCNCSLVTGMDIDQLHRIEVDHMGMTVGKSGRSMA